MGNRNFWDHGRLRRHCRDDDILESRSGGGYLIFYGAPFFATGLLATLTGLGILPQITEGRAVVAVSAASLAFGLIFMGVGLNLIFRRSGTTIDRRRNQLIQWEGLILPLQRTVHSLDLFEEIFLDCRRQGRQISFLVQLKGAKMPAVTVQQTMGDYEEANRTAEMLSCFLGKPLKESIPLRALILGPGQ